MKFVPSRLAVALITSFVIFCLGWAWSQAAPQGNNGKGGDTKVRFYVGTYTNTTSKGIYRCELDLKSGQLGKPELATEAPNPSFLVFDPLWSILYSANEVSEYQDKSTGFVSSYAIDPESGELRLVGRASSGGSGPCHLGVGASGQILATANYGDGSVAISPLNTNGAISPPQDVVRHTGSGSDPRRQEGPHAHSATFGPRGILYVADLGLDKVFFYLVDVERARIEGYDTPFVELAPGSGPRHVAFDPSGEEMYVVNELASTVTRFHPFSPTPNEQLQTISTLPAGFTGKSWPAEIAVSTDGRFLYVSNRGHDSIAIFRITDNGLVSAGFVPSGGKNPRHFAIDPSGKFMIVANQDSNNLVLFHVDAATGQLTKTNSEVSVARPVCVCFISK
jgi:6-phosphogluconolactonase